MVAYIKKGGNQKHHGRTSKISNVRLMTAAPLHGMREEEDEVGHIYISHI